MSSLLRLGGVLAALTCALSLPCLAEAEGIIKVSGTTRGGNPPLYLDYAGSNANLFKETLVRADWFRLAGSPQGARYILKVQQNGTQIQYLLSDNEGKQLGSGGYGYGAGGERPAVFRTMDDIVQAAFKNPGPCLSKIAFAAGNGKIKEIFACDFDGQGVKQLTHNNTISTEPSWLPGGSMFVYTYYKTSSTGIALYDIGGSRQRVLCTLPGTNCSPSASPDGRRLALALSRDHQMDLYVRPLESESLTRLTSDKAVESSPAWSPDGSQICYVSDSSGKPKLRLIGVGGGASRPISVPAYTLVVKSDAAGNRYAPPEPEALGESPSQMVAPSWSKVSNKIACSVRLQGRYAIGVIDMATADKVVVVTPDGGNWEDPSWAPDGRHVVCSRDQGGKRTLWQVDTWYGTVLQIAGGPTDNSLPAWSELKR